MATILITGGAGFIGSHLAKALLRAGETVRILDNLSPQIHGDVPIDLDWLASADIQFVRGSVADAATVDRALKGVDQVIHLAAETGTGQSMYEVERYYSVNCQATALLLDIIVNNHRDTIKRVILASSRSIYGEGAYECASCDCGTVFPPARTVENLERRKYEPVCDRCGTDLSVLPTTEDAQARPSSIYAATKLAQEDIVRIAAGAVGIDHAIARFQNVYGEGQSLSNPYTGILSIFSNRVRSDRFLPIFEDGLESRDFVHVSDVVSAVGALVAASAPIQSTFNVGSGVNTAVVDIARMLTEALGKEPDLRVTHEFRVGDIRHNLADIEKLRAATGWIPRVDIRTGLERFAHWLEGRPFAEDRLDSANEELRRRRLMK